MRWTERQQAMLQHIGIRLFQPQAEAPAPAPAPAQPQHATPPEPEQTTAHAAVTTTAAPHARPPRADERSVPPPRAAAPGPTSTIALHTATLGWPALHEAAASCTACALCEGRTQTVLGSGHAQAHCMIVGDPPNEAEDRAGQPFVGKPGQLLDNMLRAVGLTRSEAPPTQQVYITNAVKCAPPGHRNPSPDELAQCEPYLLRQVALVQPRVILAMGRFAVQSLLRSNEPIGRLRGRLHHYQDVPVIVTYHPAYLLRNPEDKARAWDDLCLARELLRMPQ